MISLVGISRPEFMNNPPLGLLYVGGALEKEEYEVKVFHQPSNRMDGLARQIIMDDPLFVGFSVITGDQARFSAVVSKMVKEKSEIPVVWGGVHPSLVPEQCLSEEYIDYVVIGEGEQTAVELAKGIEGKMELGNVKGIGYKKEGKPIFTARRPMIKKLDEYEMDWNLIDVKKYFVKFWGCDRVLGFITSRGCPNNCSFCYNLVFNQRRWRCHSKEHVTAEVEYLKDNYGIDGIRFNDDNFFANKRRALEILESIDLPWFGELRIEYITRNLVQKFRETQCRELLFGLESGSNRILESINKGHSVEDSLRGVEILSEFPEIRVLASLIFGLPTETAEEVQKTVDLALRLANTHPRVGFTTGVYLPFPGTDMYATALEMGFKPPEKTEDWDLMNRWQDTVELPWLTKQDIKKFAIIRDYMRLLALRNLRVPVLNRIAFYRLSKMDFTFPVELYFLNPILRKFSDKSSFLNYAINRVYPLIATKRFRSTMVKKGVS